ncbi:MAG: type II toxin-antitoxin system death-on-curing family toxin [Candidatus Omnitrophota bacterium]
MNTIKSLTVFEVEYIAFTLAQEMYVSFDEPIPDFATRFPNILESCLRTPFQSFGKKHFYPTLVHKAAVLFYLMNKNHPFQNGNKRIAVTTLLFFLYKNKRWLNVNPIELYNFANWIASSPSGSSASAIKATNDFIKKNIIESSGSPE